MKVLHVINDLDEDGGAQRIVRDLCFEMAGVQAMVLTIRTVPDGPRRALDSIGVRHVSLRSPGARNLRAAIAMIRAADVLHVHLFPCLYLAALIPKPKLFTEHNTWNRRRLRKQFRPLDRFVYARYDRVLCISDAAMRALQQWIGEDFKRGEVIENGVRLGRFTPAARTAPSVPATLIMIASFTPQKDQVTLVRAMADLPPSTRLLLVGEGPLRRESEEAVRAVGVVDRVEFRGRVPSEEVPALLAGADLLVQSSNWEGFGLVAVEAMASGVPVIATRVPGLADVVADPSLLFDAGDASALARTIDSLLSDPTRYAASSRAAIDRSRLYDARRMASQYLEVYREIVHGPGRSR